MLGSSLLPGLLLGQHERGYLLLPFAVLLERISQAIQATMGGNGTREDEELSRLKEKYIRIWRLPVNQLDHDDAPEGQHQVSPALRGLKQGAFRDLTFHGDKVEN